MIDQELTRAQITTLRRAAALLYDFGELELCDEVNCWVDKKVGRDQDS